MSMKEEVTRAVRLDLWLWAARFFKTRALAKRAIEGGKIELNGAATKPASAVHVGARMKISRGEERFEIDVLGLGEKRAPSNNVAWKTQDMPSRRPSRTSVRAG
jgi:ribosome-associated heat shock protein Hsp15